MSILPGVNMVSICLMRIFHVWLRLYFCEKKYLKVPEQNIAIMAPVKEGV